MKNFSILDTFIQNHEEFIPTNEWQIVKDGQAIPPGLHIRLNLETGLREAKLLDNTSKKSSSHDLIPHSQQEKLSKENLERAFANLDLTKDDVITDKVNIQIIKRFFF